MLRHAIELTERAHRQRVFLSDLMSEPGRAVFLRGRWRTDQFSTLEFETETAMVDGLDVCTRQSGVVLSANSPDYCSNLRKP